LIVRVFSPCLCASVADFAYYECINSYFAFYFSIVRYSIFTLISAVQAFPGSSEMRQSGITIEL
jgi:hypothetical protein